ncbi:MAG: peptide-binding protein [Chloroflexota bacterium]
MSRYVVVVAALLSAIVICSCAQQPEQRPNSIVYGTTIQPNSLNPITSPDMSSRFGIEMLFDGLVAVDDKMQLQGELATGWDVSPDGKEWVFHLRKGVKWHDGREFTAEDVKFTYDTVIDPNSKPTVSKADYAALKQVEILDPYTVRFRLSQPYAPFLSRLVLGIAPKHLLEGQDLATTAFNQKPVGTGPFMLESWTQGDSLVLKRNADYFGTKAKVDKLVWKVVPDSSVLALQALNGEVDGALIVNPKDADALRSSDKMVLYETLEGHNQISFQLKNPLFQDLKVRQALAHAIDTQAIIDGIMQGAATRASSDILPTSWAYNPDVPTYEYDPARAKALLAEAGWEPGADGILAKDGKRFEFTFMTYAGHKLREQVLMAVSQYWIDLGIDVKASTQERNSFISQKVLTGNFDVVLLETSVQIDPDISRRFHTNSIKNGQNFINYSNPTVDSLLAQGLATVETEKRKQIYYEVQKVLVEELPQIPLYYPKAYFAFKSGINGVRPAPTNLFWNAEEWEWR